MSYHLLLSPTSFYSKPDIKSKLESTWWIKITTTEPKCLYYFGSFDSKNEAVDALPGYVEDLETEQAKEIFVELMQDPPNQLTVCED